MPRDGAARTTRRTASTPARWPSGRGRLREAAQRPLPSRRIATWSLGLGRTVKVLLFIKLMGKKFSSLAFSRGANQGFHMVQILLQRLPARTGEAVFGLRQTPRERFRAGNIAGVLELARMNAQVAVGSAQKLLELVERERRVDGKRADDGKPGALVNQAIQTRRGVFRRTRAGNRSLRFLLPRGAEGC